MSEPTIEELRAWSAELLRKPDETWIDRLLYAGEWRPDEQIEQAWQVFECVYGELIEDNRAVELFHDDQAGWRVYVRGKPATPAVKWIRGYAKGHELCVAILLACYGAVKAQEPPA